MQFFTRYNPPPAAEVDLGGESMTRQDMAKECDIRYILARIGAGVEPLRASEPVFADLSDVPSDFQALQSRVLEAREAFASLPSRVRDRFANDASRMLSFLSDVNNRDEAIKLGLVKAPAPAVAPVDVPPTQG